MSILHAHAVRVNINGKFDSSTTKSESADDVPNAEALTLVIHKYNSPSNKLLRPVKIIERSDDVVVIHKSRPKRKQISRKRRPTSAYRSKIKQSSKGSSSNFGGFKDFTSSDFRYSPFPSNNFGEPPRASNKYKARPPIIESYNFNSQPNRPSSPSGSTQFSQYGPPSFNQFDSPSFNSQFGSSSTLKTLQQQQNNFPSFSIDAVNEASNSNIYRNSDVTKFSQPISNFPLESGSSFNSQKTSYGAPIRSSVIPNNFQTSLNLNSNQFTPSNNFPKLPNRYEQSDFSTPIRTNPFAENNFPHDFSIFNEVVESQKTQTPPTHNNNRFKNFNKFQNYDYDYKSNLNPSSADVDDDDDNDSLDYLFTTKRPRATTTTTTTTTTTQAPTVINRPKKRAFGRKKRPGRISQSHILDSDDLRDAFTESSDFHEVSLSSDDFLNFDSQRNGRRNAQQNLHEIHSTLKAARNQNSLLRSVLGDNFEIESIQKSLEKEPQHSNHNFAFQRKRDLNEFSVGSEISFGGIPLEWNGDLRTLPKNHKYF